MTPSILCAGAEIALNRYLRLEPAVLEECARLQNRCIEFALPAAGLVLAVEFTRDGVRVMPEAPAQPEVRVSGAPVALLGALRHVATAQPGQPSGLQVEGDAELLQQFRHMLAQVGFDPEEWLAPLIGGAAAHRLLGGLRRAFSWGRGSARRLADQSAEYLREETYDLARGRDVDAWMNEVDDAREALDRVEARLRRLESGPSNS